MLQYELFFIILPMSRHTCRTSETHPLMDKDFPFSSDRQATTEI